jgi:hypothetical protein
VVCGGQWSLYNTVYPFHSTCVYNTVYPFHSTCGQHSILRKFCSAPLEYGLPSSLNSRLIYGIQRKLVWGWYKVRRCVW